VNTLLLFTWMLLVPTTALAQLAIAGVVKDSSGAVLPGVVVEAASDALIERVRSVVSDESGQYRIVDLRPGRYVVTFTLAGFNTYKCEDLELPSDFVATVNADMRVGSLQETITGAPAHHIPTFRDTAHPRIFRMPESFDNSLTPA
jgi:hypothetical protein